MALNFDPQVLSDKVSAYFVEQSLFAGMTGIGLTTEGEQSVQNSFFDVYDQLQGRDGDTVTVPFYAKMANPAEEMVAGTPLTPESLGDNEITVAIKKYGKMVNINFDEKWKIQSSWQDESAKQIGRLLAEKVDDVVIGLLDSTNATPGSVQVDKSASSISYQVIQEALVEGFGDRFMEGNVLIIHSAQHATLANDNKFINLDYVGQVGARTQDAVVGKIGKLFVVINDQITSAGLPLVYKNYICKPQCLGLARKQMLNFESDRDISLQQDQLVATLDMGFAPLHARFSTDDKRAIEMLSQA